MQNVHIQPKIFHMESGANKVTLFTGILTEAIWIKLPAALCVPDCKMVLDNRKITPGSNPWDESPAREILTALISQK